MAITSISSSELGKNKSRVKRDAKLGSVVITTRGKPTHVLVAMGEYERLMRDLDRRTRNLPNLFTSP
jgi:PHD/YefM family antitoxin component YafN of YafNO toxin-antitoxin module